MRSRKTIPASSRFLAASLVMMFALGSVRGADKIPTSKGDLTVHPLNHATFVLKWNGKVIYNDPVGGAARFKGFGEPDVILVSDIHGDHLNAATLEAVSTKKTRIVVPAAVAGRLGGSSLAKDSLVVIANGKSAVVAGIKIEAVAMYNLTAERKRFHSKGRGNGYVLNFDKTRVYISGDTEDIPEMRRLKNIDAAFVCMNLPYTMTAEQAADAVLEFASKVVYPYHHRGQDTKKFKSLVGAKSKKIEVRLRQWYPER